MFHKPSRSLLCKNISKHGLTLPAGKLLPLNPLKFPANPPKIRISPARLSHYASSFEHNELLVPNR